MAAERLSLPAGRLPCEEIERFRGYLKVESQRLRIFHRGGGGGRAVCQLRAEMLDHLLRHAFDAYLAVLGPRHPREPLALAAVGGYGRAELNPLSDVDIMLLHARRGAEATPLVRQLMEKAVPFLWEVGLECHPLVRNIDDCVREARRQMESKTALLEARRIWGDETLFAQMRVVLEDRCLRGREDAYVEDRLRDQQKRHARWGHSYCLLEPNIKSGCGGLRDYHNLCWMTAVKFRVRSLEELVRRGVLSDAAHRQLESAYDFLLRVRTELHYQHQKRNDILTRAVQPAVAYQIGYTDRSLARRVERFMGDYYRHARNLHLITRNLERRLALRPPGRLARLGSILRGARPFHGAAVLDGFRIVDNELVASSSRILREQPRRMIRAFLIAQQRGIQLHPDLEDLIRQNLALANREFLRDPHVQKAFIEILNQRGNVARVVRAMHETGLLGKLVPAFHDLTCRVQHEFFHLYTADEHTLVCLEVLDRVWNAGSEPYVHYADIFRGIDRPYVLYLALLLHDVGKAEDSKDHSVESARLALAQCRRLQLPAPASTTVAFLVRHHLLMVRLSQKLDLDDPEVIHRFAETVQTSEHLHLLTLHTFADSMATSESLWTPFKESLLWTLHRRAESVLAGDVQLREAAETRIRRLRTEVRKLLPRSIQNDEIDAHFENLPERYFAAAAPRDVAADIVLIHRFMWNQVATDEGALVPVVSWRAEPDLGYSVLRVCTWDRPRLFNRITGALAAAGLNILGARVFTRADGPVLDTLFVNNPVSGRPPGRAAREEFQDLLSRSLCGEPVDFQPLIERHRTPAPIYLPAAQELIPTRVAFDNQIHADSTVIEIETEDRLGLLHDLTGALADLGLNVTFARISTEKGAAVDTFYVTEEDGSRVDRPERLREIERRLRDLMELTKPVPPS